jgi:hypothetical protein
MLRILGMRKKERGKIFDRQVLFEEVKRVLKECDDLN